MDKHLLAAVCLSLTTAGTACTPEQLALFVDAISNPGDDHSGDPPPPSEDPWVSTEQDLYVSSFLGIRGAMAAVAVDDQRAYILSGAGEYDAMSYRVEAVDVTGASLSLHAHTALGGLAGSSYPLAVFATPAGAEFSGPLAARMSSPGSFFDGDLNAPLTLTIDPVSGLNGDVPSDLLQVDDGDALANLEGGTAGEGPQGLYAIAGNHFVHARMDWANGGRVVIDYRELSQEGLGSVALHREIDYAPGTFGRSSPVFALDDALGGVVVRGIARTWMGPSEIEFVSIATGERTFVPTSCTSELGFSAARTPIVSDRGTEFVVAETCSRHRAGRSEVRLFAVSAEGAPVAREIGAFGIDHGSWGHNSPHNNGVNNTNVSLATTPDHILVNSLHHTGDESPGNGTSESRIFRIEHDGRATLEQTLVLDATARHRTGDEYLTHDDHLMVHEALSNGTDFFVVSVVGLAAIERPEQLESEPNLYPYPIDGLKTHVILRRIRPN